MGQFTEVNSFRALPSLKGSVAMLGLLAIILSVGLFARQQERAIGVYATGIYDSTFISTKFVDAAAQGFQSYTAALPYTNRQGPVPHLPASVLDDLDVAMERAQSADFTALAQIVRTKLSALKSNTIAGGPSSADLQGARESLQALSRKSWSSALRSRDKITAFEARADRLMLFCIGASAVLTCGVSALLRHAMRQRQQSLARVAHMAHHDTLTDLPNRRSFHQALTAALSGQDRGCAVLSLDLDRFKPVNDTLGHPVGDALLIAVSARLRSATRGSDFVGRLGGDEFAVVADFTGDAETVAVLAQRIISTLSKPYDIFGHTLVIGASIGIATSLGGDDADLLIRNSDLALYRSKQSGRGTYRFFEPEMDTIAQRRRALESELRSAIERQEFEVRYQPLISVETGGVSQFEALVRWKHPEKGLLTPDGFIALAEEVGLITAIDELVLEAACREAATWPGDIGLAVNVSPTEFGRSRLVDRITAALKKSGLPASRLELEITERMLLEDSEATLATLHELRELGVRISMDDFGTGYSSLSYLRSFPFDKLKIDRSFISGCGDSAENTAIVRAIASMGRSLGIATTAEGVETRAQMDRLVADGCTELQGYFFSRPCHPNDIPGLLGEIAKRAA